MIILSYFNIGLGQAHEQYTGLKPGESIVFQWTRIKSGNCVDFCGDNDFYIDISVSYIDWFWSKFYSMCYVEHQSLVQSNTVEVGRSQERTSYTNSSPLAEIEVTYNDLDNGDFYQLKEKYPRNKTKLYVSLYETDGVLNLVQSDFERTIVYKGLELKELISKLRHLHSLTINLNNRDGMNTRPGQNAQADIKVFPRD